MMVNYILQLINIMNTVQTDGTGGMGGAKGMGFQEDGSGFVKSDDEKPKWSCFKLI